MTENLVGIDDSTRSDISFRHDRLKAEGVLCPWVFHRTGKEMKGKRIVRFTKAWRKACKKAGSPGRIPHDLRRTAVRNLVTRPSRAQFGHSDPPIDLPPIDEPLIP